MRVLAILGLLLTAFDSNAAPVDQRILAKTITGPMGLRGNDFQILTTADLAANACLAEPEPFPPRKGAFAYWQCFETGRVNFDCGNANPSHRHPGEDFFAFIVSETGVKQEYLFRRPIGQVGCQLYRNRWKALTRGQRHVCLSGTFIEAKGKIPQAETWSWIFDKYKTRSGCDSYFEHACDSKMVIQETCSSK